MSAHRSIVNTVEGDKAELYCDYDSPSSTKIIWRKDDNIISAEHEQRDHAKYIILDAPKKHHDKHEEKNSSILIINNVDKNDLGEYECSVKNQIGSGNVKIQLTFVPEAPHLDNLEQNGETVTTHWVIRSYQPLEEVTLNYQQKGVNLFLGFLFIPIATLNYTVLSVKWAPAVRFRVKMAIFHHHLTFHHHSII